MMDKYVFEYQDVKSLDELNRTGSAGYWESPDGKIYVKYYNIVGLLKIKEFSQYRYAKDFFKEDVYFDKREREKREITFVWREADNYDDFVKSYSSENIFTEVSEKICEGYKAKYRCYMYELDGKVQMVKFDLWDEDGKDVDNYFDDVYNAEVIHKEANGEDYNKCWLYDRDEY